MQGQLKYQPIWGFLYLFFGIVFGLLFLASAYYLGDPSIYLNTFAAALLVFIGYTMRTKPYVVYTKEKIIVFGLFGNERRRYDLKNKPALTLKNERFYFGKEKLKFNKWFIDKKDWERVKHFYNQEMSLIDELQD